MSESPDKPNKPKHVPFWPVLAAIAFMVAVIGAGIVASNKARTQPHTIVTSTLPPRNTTSTTAVSKQTTSSVTVVTSAGNAADCNSVNLVKAAEASGHVDKTLIGTLQAQTYRCISGYAVASLKSSKPDQETVIADFKLENGAWVMLNLGQVDLVADGVPSDVANQLAANYR